MLKENAQTKDYILESVFQKEINDNNSNNYNNSKNKLEIVNNTNNKINTENFEKVNNMNENEDINYNNYFFFYQEEEGDIYYLEPFIMNILLTEYGDYNNLPVEISGNILDFEMKQITPYLKSNYPFLSHLNVGSIIFFVEIDINDMISSSTKKIYQEKLDERNRLRNLLKYQEKNFEDFVNKRNNKLFEEEKNNSLENSKKSLEQISISGPIFFGTDESHIFNLFKQ